MSERVKIDDNGNLVFTKPKKAKGSAPVIRISAEAYELLTQWEAETGLSLSYIASEFIKYADSRTLLERE